jgi:hypothetical protein
MIQVSPTRIEYYALDQWAGAVSELVARKLEAELGLTGGGPAAVVLTGTVLECGQVDVPGGAEGRLVLRARFGDPDARPDAPALLEKTYRCVEPAASRTPGAVAESLSRCAEKIAAEIAADAAEVVEIEER